MERFHWGWRISIVYVLFAGGTLAFVVFAMTNRVDLVRNDYYEASLRHDTMMSERANALSVGATISVDTSMVYVHIPEGAVPDKDVKFQFYREDLPELDRVASGSVNSYGIAQAETRDFKHGKWTVTARWTSRDMTYEVEQPFYVK